MLLFELAALNQSIPAGFHGELLCGAEEGRGALPVFSLLLPAAKLFSPDSPSRSLLPF